MRQPESSMFSREGEILEVAYVSNVRKLKTKGDAFVRSNLSSPRWVQSGQGRRFKTEHAACKIWRLKEEKRTHMKPRARDEERLTRAETRFSLRANEPMYLVLLERTKGGTKEKDRSKRSTIIRVHSSEGTHGGPRRLAKARSWKSRVVCRIQDIPTQ